MTLCETNLSLFLTQNQLRAVIMTGSEALEYVGDMISEGTLKGDPSLIVAEVSLPGVEGAGWGSNYKSYSAALLEAAIAFQKVMHQNILNNTINEEII